LELELADIWKNYMMNLKMTINADSTQWEIISRGISKVVILDINKGTIIILEHINIEQGGVSCLPDLSIQNKGMIFQFKFFPVKNHIGFNVAKILQHHALKKSANRNGRFDTAAIKTETHNIAIT